MKVTKKVKPVVLSFKEVQYTQKIASYMCPTCKTTFEFHGWGKSVDITRFKCSCGQELSVSKNFIEIP